MLHKSKMTSTLKYRVSAMVLSGAMLCGSCLPALAAAYETAAAQSLDEGALYNSDAASEENGFLFPWEALFNDDYQLTMQDLRQLCGADLAVCKNQNGDVLYLGGDCSVKPVTDEQSAARAANQLRTILGIPTSGLELVFIKAEKSAGDSTFYMFRGLSEQTQTYSQEGAVYIEAGSSGEVLAVSATAPESWQDAPEQAELTEDELSELDEYAKQFGGYVRAEDIGVRQSFVHTSQYTGNAELVYYRDGKGHVMELPYVNGDVAYPLFFSESDFDPVTREKSADAYSFDYLIEPARGKTEVWKVTDYFGSTVELPVYYDETAGKYYAVDPEHKMVLTKGCIAEDGSMDYSKLTAPYYFSDPTELDSSLVSAWWNLERTAQAYSEIGFDNAMRNVPIVLAASDYKDGTADEGDDYGAVTVYVYDSLYKASFDMMAHELTHGVQQSMSENTNYYNESGAIMESYADIMAILIEQSLYEQYGSRLGYQDMEKLLFGEEVGLKLAERSPQDPNDYGQPAYVGDIGYVINVPNEVDESYYFGHDYGGVHFNSGILNHVAYRMCKEADIDAETLLKVWYDALIVFNKDQTYASIGQTVLANLKKYGVSDEKVQKTAQFLDEAGAYNEADTWANIENDKSKSTKVTLKLHGGSENDLYSFVIYYLCGDESTEIYTPMQADVDGILGAIVPNGTNIFTNIQMQVKETEPGGVYYIMDLNFYAAENNDKLAETDGTDIELAANTDDLKTAAINKIIAKNICNHNGIGYNPIAGTEPFALLTIQGADTDESGRELIGGVLLRKPDEGDNMSVQASMDKKEYEAAHQFERAAVKNSEYTLQLEFVGQDGETVTYTADNIKIGTEDGYVLTYEIEDGQLIVSQTTAAEANAQAGKKIYNDISAITLETEAEADAEADAQGEQDAA